MTLGITGLVAVAISAGVAVAINDSAQAPYAQAGAVVKPDGDLRQAKGVEEVKHLEDGKYCVKFRDTDFDPGKNLPSVTSLSGSRMISYAWQSGCDAKNNSALVFVRNQDGKATDGWFSIVIN